MALPLDRVVLGFQVAYRLVEKCGQTRFAAHRGQLGGLRSVVQPSLEDAADNREVELACAHQQQGKEVEAGVLTEITHCGRIALAHLDQTGG
jgi:hypothetical protein